MNDYSNNTFCKECGKEIKKKEELISRTCTVCKCQWVAEIIADAYLNNGLERNATKT